MTTRLTVFNLLSFTFLFIVISVLTGCWGNGDTQSITSFLPTTVLLNPDSCSIDEQTGEVDCNIVYVATLGDGIFKSTDGGQSLTRSVTGLFDFFITVLAMDPENPEVLYAGTENSGLFRSFDGGESWTVATGDITSITAITVDPNTCQFSPCGDIYVGSQESGVWVSTDSGSTWEQVGVLTEPAVTAISLHSYSIFPSDLYAATEGGHVLKFNRLNNQWEEGNPGLSVLTKESALVIAVHPLIPTRLYAGMSGGESEIGTGVYRSDDDGNSWSLVSIPTDKQFSVYAVTFCLKSEQRCPETVVEDPPDPPVDEEDFLLVGVNGLSKQILTDEGFATWQTIDLEEPFQGGGVVSLAIDPLTHRTWYVGTFFGLVLKSLDAGATWTRLDING